MAKPELDIVRRVMEGREINSPGLVTVIDEALEEIERQKEELRLIRQMAARRLGESEGPSSAQESAAPKQPQEKTEAGESASSNETLAWLAEKYQTDPDSPYSTKAYATRQNYIGLIRRLVADQGGLQLKDIDARMILRLHEGWSADGKLAMGHAMIGIIRILMNFGGSILGNADCARIASILQKMRFEMSKRGGGAGAERLTEEHAKAFIRQAHKEGADGIALAQALQFDCKLRQKEVIGEWVPEDEAGESNIKASDGRKWVRGLMWEHIETADGKRLLKHPKIPRKRINLSDTAPLVQDEIFRRWLFAEKGPMVIDENTGLPYRSYDFRRVWRRIATAAGIPPNVKNMDSRMSDDD